VKINLLFLTRRVNGGQNLSELYVLLIRSLMHSIGKYNLFVTYILIILYLSIFVYEGYFVTTQIFAGFTTFQYEKLSPWGKL
jgi:hypothetical protein